MIVYYDGNDNDNDEGDSDSDSDYHKNWNDDRNDTDKKDPVHWSGSSYSWKKPSETTATSSRAAAAAADDDDDESIGRKNQLNRRQRHRRGRRDRNGHLPTIQTLEYRYCGTITIHQNPEILDVDHDKDNMHQRTGVTLWSASYALADYLDCQFGNNSGRGYDDDDNTKEDDNTKRTSPPQSIPQRRKSTRSKNERRRWNCVELGSGLGLPSIIAGKHGCNVIATEHDPQVIPLLQQNMQQNMKIITNAANISDTCIHTTEHQQVIQIESLDWKMDPSELYDTATIQTLRRLGGADMIIMSDLIYNATQPSWSDLLTIVKVLREQKRQIEYESRERDGWTNDNDNGKDNIDDPIVLLGYTQRRRDMTPDEEGLFFAMAKQQYGMEVHQIPFTEIPNSDKRIMTSIFQLHWK